MQFNVMNTPHKMTFLQIILLNQYLQAVSHSAQLNLSVLSSAVRIPELKSYQYCEFYLGYIHFLELQ